MASRRLSSFPAGGILGGVLFAAFDPPCQKQPFAAAIPKKCKQVDFNALPRHPAGHALRRLIGSEADQNDPDGP